MSLIGSDTQLNRRSYYEASVDRGPARAPLQAGDYVVSSFVNQVNADGSATLLKDLALTLRVAGAAELADAAFTGIQAVVAADAPLVAKTNALNWLSLAKMSMADNRWSDALRQLAAAQSAAQALAGADAEAARLAIARAIEAVEKRL